MVNISNRTPAESIRAELESSRISFHTLLDSLSEEDLRRQSLNVGWTNGEILAHMLFRFIVVNVLLALTRAWGRLPKGSSKPFAMLLNAITKPFNWVNAWGARMQGRAFTHQRLGTLFDRIYASLLKKAASIKDRRMAARYVLPHKMGRQFQRIYDARKAFSLSGYSLQFPSNATIAPQAIVRLLSDKII